MPGGGGELGGLDVRFVRARAAADGDEAEVVELAEGAVEDAAVNGEPVAELVSAPGQALEDDGVIVGYTALLNPLAMGHAFEVLVNVDLTHKDRDTVERFEAEVAALDEVIEVRRTFGLPDYLVRVGTPDLEAFEAFVTAGLGAVPDIAKVDSHLTMKVVKSPERPEQPEPGGSRRRAG